MKRFIKGIWLTKKDLKNYWKKLIILKPKYEKKKVDSIGLYLVSQDIQFGKKTKNERQQIHHYGFGK